MCEKGKHRILGSLEEGHLTLPEFNGWKKALWRRKQVSWV